jgi:hypothetical protein
MAGAERLGLAAGLNGLLVGAESLGGALLLFGRRQIFLAGGNGQLIPNGSRTCP